MFQVVGYFLGTDGVAYYISSALAYQHRHSFNKQTCAQQGSHFQRFATLARSALYSAAQCALMPPQNHGSYSGAPSSKNYVPCTTVSYRTLRLSTSFGSRPVKQKWCHTVVLLTLLPRPLALTHNHGFLQQLTWSKKFLF